MSSCGNHDCGDPNSRSGATTALAVCVIVMAQLIIGALACTFYSRFFGRSQSSVSPLSNSRNNSDLYLRATSVFSGLFSRQRKKEIDWNELKERIIPMPATHKRQLESDSCVFDLTHETNILYSGSTLMNNVIARGTYMEYYFGRSEALDYLRAQREKGAKNSATIALSTIDESTNHDIDHDRSDLSSSIDPDHQQVIAKREIVVFSGEEERVEEWFLEDSEMHNEDFFLTLQDLSSEDTDLVFEALVLAQQKESEP